MEELRVVCKVFPYRSLHPSPYHLKSHLFGHAASPLASEVLELVDITDVLCLGNANPAAVEAFSAWGARFRSHHSGYNREIVAPR